MRTLILFEPSPSESPGTRTQTLNSSPVAGSLLSLLDSHYTPWMWRITCSVFSADPSETLLKSSEPLDSNHLHFFHLLPMTMFSSCTRKSAKTGECCTHGDRAHTGRDQGQVQPRRPKAEYLGEIKSYRRKFSWNHNIHHQVQRVKYRNKRISTKVSSWVGPQQNGITEQFRVSAWELKTVDMHGSCPLNELSSTWGKQRSFWEAIRARHAYAVGLAFTLDWTFLQHLWMGPSLRLRLIQAAPSHCSLLSLTSFMWDTFGLNLFRFLQNKI